MNKTIPDLLEEILVACSSVKLAPFTLRPLANGHDIQSNGIHTHSLHCETTKKLSETNSKTFSLFTKSIAYSYRSNSKSVKYLHRSIDHTNVFVRETFVHNQFLALTCMRERERGKKCNYTNALKQCIVACVALQNFIETPCSIP